MPDFATDERDARSKPVRNDSTIPEYKPLALHGKRFRLENKQRAMATQPISTPNEPPAEISAFRSDEASIRLG